jgi:capsular polysaccharide biosynthesis protein
MTIATTGRGSTGTEPGTPGDRPLDGVPGETPTPAWSPADEPSPQAGMDLAHPNGRATDVLSPDVRSSNGDRGSREAGLRVLVQPRRRRRLTPLHRVLLLLLVIALVGVGALAGRMVADRMPKMYAAHADVLYPLVQEQPTGFLRQDRNLSTQEVLLTGRTVLDPVAAQFKVPVEDLVDQLSTEVVDESEVIRVQFTDPSRAQARKVLLAIVSKYVEVSNNPQRTALRAYLDAQLADVQARLATARAAAAGQVLGLTQAAQAEIDALVQRETTLQGQIDVDQLAAIGGPAPQVTVVPYVEHDAVSPQPLLVTAGGALAGLVVGLIVVAVLARRMTRP